MAFAGLKQDDEQANMIAYLATFSGDAGGDAAASNAAPADDASKQAASDSGAAAANAAATPPAAAEAAHAGSASEGQAAAGLVLGLGRAATDEEIAAWDIDIRPDGLGLPVGKGTVSDGEPIYEAQCASCHGDFGEAVDRWPLLAGGHGSLQDDRPVKTIGSYWPYPSTIFDFIRRAMPFGNARSLSDDEVYALTAYVLYLNDVVTDEEFELSNENFASVKLPNEPNFVADDRLSEPHYVDKSEPCMENCIPGAPQISMHAAVLDVTPEDSNDDEAPAAGIE
jgi:cytochrome c